MGGVLIVYSFSPPVDFLARGSAPAGRPEPSVNEFWKLDF